VTGTFSTTAQVRQALDDLIGGGIAPDELSAVTASGKPIENLNFTSTEETEHMMTGAGVGALIGAGAGVLLAPLLIPGAGLLLAAGAFAVSGALGGSLIGMLVEAGHTKDEAEAIASEVKSGKYVVTVHTKDADADLRAELELRKAGAENIVVSQARPSAASA
jgi:uncharacterized membrane protein